MASSTFAVFLLLLVNAASAGLLYSRNSDGLFRAVEDSTQPTTTPDCVPYEPADFQGDTRATTCNPDLPPDFQRQPEKPEEVKSWERHDGSNIVKSPLDDEDLELVQEYLQDTKINKTGQLRYSSLEAVERALIKDIVRIILKDDEYKLLLNNPSFPDVVGMIKTMLRKPTQQVLQQQILSKVLAVQAYYNKFYKPLNNPESKQEALEFLRHLKTAAETNQLTVKDTKKLNEKLKHLAYLHQEKPFEQSLSDLENTIGKNERENPETTTDSSDDSEIHESVIPAQPVERKSAKLITPASLIEPSGPVLSSTVSSTVSEDVSSTTELSTDSTSSEPSSTSSAASESSPATKGRNFVDPGANY